MQVACILALDSCLVLPTICRACRCGRSPPFCITAILPERFSPHFACVLYCLSFSRPCRRGRCSFSCMMAILRERFHFARRRLYRHRVWRHFACWKVLRNAECYTVLCSRPSICPLSTGFLLLKPDASRLACSGFRPRGVRSL